jgi:hypothetical protein
MFSVTSVLTDAMSNASVIPNCCSSHGEIFANACPTRSGMRRAASTTSACTSGISTRKIARSRKPNSSTTTVVERAREIRCACAQFTSGGAEVREDRADQERRQHGTEEAQPEEDHDPRTGDPRVVARREHPARTRRGRRRGRRLGERGWGFVRKHRRRRGGFVGQRQAGLGHFR